MGVIVPDYVNKWGHTCSVYISLASADIRLASFIQPDKSGWSILGQFSVYKDYQSRVENPYKPIETVSFSLEHDSKYFNNNCVFDAIYAHLLTLYPNSVREDNGVVVTEST